MRTATETSRLIFLLAIFYQLLACFKLISRCVSIVDITPVQATVQWVLRDGASMLGGLLFTSFTSANFGQNIKSWRLFADYINNVGITLDVIAPLSKRTFLPIICLASVCKALCGIAAGATGSVISEHWGSKQGDSLLASLITLI